MNKRQDMLLIAAVALVLSCMLGVRLLLKYQLVPDNQVYSINAKLLPAGVHEDCRETVLPQSKLPAPNSQQLRQYPFLYWQIWSEQPLSFYPSLLFMLLFAFTSWGFWFRPLQRARKCCAAQFWLALLCGMLAPLLCLVAARVLLVTGIFTPLATLTLAVMELGLLLGMAVSSSLIGHHLCLRLKVKAAANAKLQFAGELVLGVIVMSCFLLIPGGYGLPRVGVRLVMLIAMLGLGGLLLSRQQGNSD